MFCPSRTTSGGQPRTKVVIICLQALIACPSFGSLFPNRRCPYQYLGCSLEGFTAFHLNSFLFSYVTVALSRYSYHIQKNLGVFSAVNQLMVTLTYDFVKHEHYKHHSLCEHGLSSTYKNMQRLLQHSFHNSYYCIMHLLLVNSNKWRLFLIKFCSKDCFF